MDEARDLIETAAVDFESDHVHGDEEDRDVISIEPVDPADVKPDPIAAFLTTIAHLVTDGEPDANGDEFDMPSDDAVETLHGLIDEARRLRGGDGPRERP